MRHGTLSLMKNLGQLAWFELCVLLLAFAVAASDIRPLSAASEPTPPATEGSLSPDKPTNSKPTRLSRVKSSTAPAKADVPGAFAKAAPASINDLKAIERHVKTLMPRLTPAVVAVEVGGATGSGVVISEDGVVLTAAHVSDEPNRDVRFTFPDGKTARGKTLGTNHELDAGMARITDPGPWPHVPIGDLNGARLGDWVLTLGQPGGYEKERPIVVRLGRIIRLTAGALQTDCTVTAGDSGGPLVDMHGKVIGIHSRISDSTSENFHVPISAYSDSWDRLAKGENWGGSQPPSRSWVG
ncbi:MAG: serine protease, partial [Phycisphaerales bacterium]|nr:serine protease [Phycisphaerales bacterium]